jgi:hypothetical protein
MRFRVSSVLLTALAVAILAGYGAVAGPSEASRSDDLPDFRPTSRAAKRAESPVARDEVEPTPTARAPHERQARTESIYVEPLHRGRDIHLRIGVLLI